MFTLDGPQLAWALILYGAIASSLPVWLMLAPRDYLSTFLKIGTIVALAIGIYVRRAAAGDAGDDALHRRHRAGIFRSAVPVPVHHHRLRLGVGLPFADLLGHDTQDGRTRIAHAADRLRRHADGVVRGDHGADRRLRARSRHLLRDELAVRDHRHDGAQNAAQVISSWGFTITPDMINQTAADIGENSILSRAGGAPTLAVGMAKILAQAMGGKSMEAFWYHFAILFEALFILTAVDAGTRVGRFMIQDMLGHVYKPMGNTEFLPANLVGTGLCVAMWGYFLYQGVIDPLGGINTLWQLFGVGNQMLAGIALLLCTSVLVKMKRERYVWVTLVPTAWLLDHHADRRRREDLPPAIRASASWRSRGSSATPPREGKVLAPAKSIAEMQRVAFNNYLDAVVCGFFVLLVARDVCFRGKDLPAGAEAGEPDGAGNTAARARRRE